MKLCVRARGLVFLACFAFIQPVSSVAMRSAPLRVWDAVSSCVGGALTRFRSSCLSRRNDGGKLSLAGSSIGEHAVTDGLPDWALDVLRWEEGGKCPVSLEKACRTYPEVDLIGRREILQNSMPFLQKCMQEAISVVGSPDLQEIERACWSRYAIFGIRAWINDKCHTKYLAEQEKLVKELGLLVSEFRQWSDYQKDYCSSTPRPTSLPALLGGVKGEEVISVGEGFERTEGGGTPASLPASSSVVGGISSDDALLKVSRVDGEGETSELRNGWKWNGVGGETELMLVDGSCNLTLRGYATLNVDVSAGRINGARGVTAALGGVAVTFAVGMSSEGREDFINLLPLSDLLSTYDAIVTLTSITVRVPAVDGENLSLTGFAVELMELGGSRIVVLEKCLYRGEVSDLGSPSGNGKLVIADGSVYKGRFDFGTFESGTVAYPDGRKFRYNENCLTLESDAERSLATIDDEACL